MSRSFRTLARVTALLLVATVPALAQDKDLLEKCDRPIGTLAVAEPKLMYMQFFARYSLGSPTTLLRMMAQQSRCFVVLERGAGMEVIKGERELSRSGEAQAGSNMGGGQMVLADFVMSPEVQVVAKDAGGVGGAIAGLGRSVASAGLLAVGVSFKEAATTLLIADARTTVQVAAAEGKAKRTDFSLGMLGWGFGAVGGARAYTSTADGKVVAASYLDNFNALVKQLQGDSAIMARAAAFDASILTNPQPPSAGIVFAEGDVLTPKVDNVQLLSAPLEDAQASASLQKGDDLVFLGQEDGGFLKVQGAAAVGWVKRTLVAKK